MRRILVVTVLCVLALSGCRFDGVTSLPLPATVGTGDGAYTVRVELPDAGALTPNAQVKVDDVAVGTVTGLAVQNWHAVVTVNLRDDVALPANATATVGRNSLLGASYLAMAPPDAEPPRGRLVDGDTVPLARGRSYPTAEQVLAATAVVLNGSGLGQLETITSELNRALGGQNRAVADLLPRLETFVSGLDAQKTEIVAAIEGLNRFSGQLARQNEVLIEAVQGVGPALEVLNRERADLTAALVALDDLGEVANRVITGTREDLIANLRDLEPTLRSLADAQRSLVDSLGIALTFPFPSATVPRTCPGDYCNLFATIDLTLSTLDTNFLSGTPLQGRLAGLEGLLGQPSGIAGQAVDPLRTPAQLPPSPAHRGQPGPPAPAPGGAPSPPSNGDGDGLLGPLPGGGQ